MLLKSLQFLHLLLYTSSYFHKFTFVIVYYCQFQLLLFYDKIINFIMFDQQNIPQWLVNKCISQEKYSINIYQMRMVLLPLLYSVALLLHCTMQIWIKTVNEWTIPAMASPMWSYCMCTYVNICLCTHVAGCVLYRQEINSSAVGKRLLGQELEYSSKQGSCRGSPGT